MIRMSFVIHLKSSFPHLLMLIRWLRCRGALGSLRMGWAPERTSN